MSTDLTGKKKRRKKLTHYVCASCGASHPLDRGCDSGATAVAQGVMEGLREKHMSSIEPMAGGAVHSAHRVSESYTDGHASPSRGDHGTGQGRNGSVAAYHPDLRQSNTDFGQVLSRLRTVRGNTVDLNVPDTTSGGFSHAGEVALRLFDGAAQAGRFGGMQRPNPDPYRPDYHQERGSATPPNGTHHSDSQYWAGCTPRQSENYGKSPSRLDIMKQHQRIIGQ